MNKGVNKVILVGNVGQEPKYTKYDDDKERLSFSLATMEKFNNKEFTEWHNIVIWGKFAGAVKSYIHKGSALYIEGRIQSRKYTTEIGEDRWITEVVCNNLLYLDKPVQQGNTQSGSNDDLPF